MTYINRAATLLDVIRARGQYREVQPSQISGVIDFTSNDYLALSTNPSVVQAFRSATRAGSTGARLLGGRHREHSLLEEELAAWLGRERALLFSSGYHAAIGAIPALAACVDAIDSDTLNHASLIDGIRLSRVLCRRYPHGELPLRDDRTRATLVVTESVFGMDGDVVDVSAILSELGDDDVLFVDEAHALGVTGREGAGLARNLDDPRVIVLGTLSKAFGVHGGFIAGPARAIELLVNTARTFIFDTALPPAIALAARVALVEIRKGDDLRARLRENVSRLRTGLRESGISVPESPAPVTSIVLGDEMRAVRASQRLMERGLAIPAIRPPTVPQGASCLRISVRIDHTNEAIDAAIAGIAACTATS